MDQIENQIIRKVDPKSPANAFTLKTLYPEIHAAVSCAAISCPPLWNQVWKEDNVMATLKERFALLVNRSKFVRILDGKPEVSKIFEWFYIDFSQEGKTPGEWLSQFIKDKKVSDTVKAAKTAKDFVFMEYDWTVNDQKNKK